MDRLRNVNVPEDETLYNLRTEWSDKEADYVFILTKLQEDINGERRAFEQVSGDKSWAKRIAKHYGLEVPKA